MALKKTEGTHPFSIEGIEGITFSKVSDDLLIWPEIVAFGSKNDGILQSAREAAAFSIEADREDKAYLYHLTRTGVIYFKAGNNFYAAIDDIVDPAQNIIIAYAKRGYESHRQVEKFLLPVSDNLVRGFLNRAEKTGRIVEITEGAIEPKTKAVNGKSEFGQNDWNKAILVDFSEPYAQMLNKRDFISGIAWSLSYEDLKYKGVDGNNVEVRPVGLKIVTATNRFIYVGHARSVRGAREVPTRIVELPDKNVYGIVRKICT